MLLLNCQSFLSFAVFLHQEDLLIRSVDHCNVKDSDQWKAVMVKQQKNFISVTVKLLASFPTRFLPMFFEFKF